MSTPRARKGTPYPFRPDPDSEVLIEQLKGTTGLSKAEILRRACKWSLPRFLDGTADILKAGQVDDEAMAQDGAAQMALPMGKGGAA